MVVIYPGILPPISAPSAFEDNDKMPALIASAGYSMPGSWADEVTEEIQSVFSVPMGSMEGTSFGTQHDTAGGRDSPWSYPTSANCKTGDTSYVHFSPVSSFASGFSQPSSLASASSGPSASPVSIAVKKPHLVSKEDAEVEISEQSISKDALAAVSEEPLSGTTLPNGQKSNRYASSSVDPRDQLLFHRDLFFRSHSCPKCSTAIAPDGEGLANFFSVLSQKNYARPLSCIQCRISFCPGCLKVTPKREQRPRRVSNVNLANVVVECCPEVRAMQTLDVLEELDKAHLAQHRNTVGKVLVRRVSVLGLKLGVKPGKAKPSTSSSITPSTPSAGLTPGLSPIPPKAIRRFSLPAESMLSSTSHLRASTVPDLGPNSDVYDNLTALKKWEQKLVYVFRSLSLLLNPSGNTISENTQNTQLHPSVPALLSVSLLPETLQELLRNDTMEELIQRSQVYHAMLDFLQVLGTHPSTFDVIVKERYMKRTTCGVVGFLEAREGVEWEVEGQRPRSLLKSLRSMSNLLKRRQSDTSTLKAGQSSHFQVVTSRPLYYSFGKLVKQCEAFMDGLASMGTSDPNTDPSAEDPDTAVIIALCKKAVKIRNELALKLSTTDAKGSGNSTKDSPNSSADKGKKKANPPVVNPDAQYTAMCENQGFEYVSLGKANTWTQVSGFSYSSHAFSSAISSTASSTRNPKQRIQLLKELTVMSTSLPNGIWVRVDEVRNDVLKALIAGPSGTPYEGGLFEFDIFVPIDYPSRPPEVKLKTTGGGSVRFNPNLYNDGKVCLSLLGTWSGSPEEMWKPGTSTLLQVLISIQSLILVDAPYFNEPGFGTPNMKDARSVSYNANLHPLTVRWGMVDWMEKVKANNKSVEIWADVVAAHFTIYQERIRVKVKEWATADMLDKFDQGCTHMATLQS